MKQPVPLAAWLDENLPGWRSRTPEQLDLELRPMFRAGRFRKLRAHTRNVSAEAVNVGDGWFAYIEF
jgi:hypothetical protein